MVKNPPAMQETWVRSLGQEDPLEKEKTQNQKIMISQGFPGSPDGKESTCKA